MRRLASASVLAVLLLSACGEERAQPPDVFAVKEPRGAKKEAFRKAGIELERPANWKLRRRDPPGVFEILSGEALISGWAYSREETLPESQEQLEAATKRLVEAIVERDPGYRVDSARPTEVAGSPAIEVQGAQVISKRRLRTRSVHVFEGEVEYVFEALAPRDVFGRTDKALQQILESVRLTGEVK